MSSILSRASSQSSSRILRARSPSTTFAERSTITLIFSYIRGTLSLSIFTGPVQASLPVRPAGRPSHNGSFFHYMFIIRSKRLLIKFISKTSLIFNPISPSFPKIGEGAALEDMPPENRAVGVVRKGQADVRRRCCASLTDSSRLF